MHSVATSIINKKLIAMNKTISLILITAFTLTANFSFCQELPRSASFGALVSDINDSLSKVLNLSSQTGTLIKDVVPGSSAQRSGISINDVLISMDGENIKNTEHFLQLLKKHHGGDEVRIKFYRKSKLQTTTMTLLPRQKETSEDFNIIYSSVLSGNNHLRTIITKPKTGNIFPAVLLIGGVGCYSIDNTSLQEIRSIKMWADSLARNGFVTIRIDKTGMGDSQGIPCDECDFKTEKQGFLDGLKQLKSLPYVDQKNIFIAGFSIGGVIAPLIAQEEHVKGIIVYGTVGRNWFEYELDNSYRQQLLAGQSADSIDQFMRAEYIRLYEFLVKKKLPEQIIKEHPETKNNFFGYPMRPEYFQQVADINIRETWMNTKAIVLILHGSSDFVSSAREHKSIEELVNHYNPGKASYFEIDKSDHWSLFAETELQSFLNQQTELNHAPMTISIEWLKDNS